MELLFKGNLTMRLTGLHKTLIVRTDQGSKGQGHLLSCFGQLKITAARANGHFVDAEVGIRDGGVQEQWRGCQGQFF